MGKNGQRLNYYPTVEDIANLNRKLILQTGGNADGAGRFHNANSLEWVLGAIQYSLFDVDRHPTISEKAALLAWVIITRHVFIDGNKRTGFASMELFLEDNGFYISAKDDEIFVIADTIAKSSINGYTLEQFTVWVRTHLKLFYPPPY